MNKGKPTLYPINHYLSDAGRSGLPNIVKRAASTDNSVMAMSLNVTKVFYLVTGRRLLLKIETCVDGDPMIAFVTTHVS